MSILSAPVSASVASGQPAMRMHAYMRLGSTGVVRGWRVVDDGARLTEVGQGLEGDDGDARAVDDLDVRGDVVMAHERRELEQRPLLRFWVIVRLRHRYHHVRVPICAPLQPPRTIKIRKAKMEGDAPVGEV